MGSAPPIYELEFRADWRSGTLAWYAYLETSGADMSVYQHAPVGSTGYQLRGIRRILQNALPATERVSAPVSRTPARWFLAHLLPLRGSFW